MYSTEEYKAFHVSDLYLMAKNGDRDALFEIVSRQQQGRGLRYYPNGRQSPEHDGMIALHIETDDRGVVIRSGRTNRELMIDMSTAETWLRGIPVCLTVSAERLVARGEASNAADAVLQLNDSADKDFHSVCSTNVDDNMLVIQFFPTESSEWHPSVVDCARLVRSIYTLSEQMQWTFDLNEVQKEAIEALIDIANEAES